MGDAMDGVMHEQRPIAKPRTRKVTLKRTSKRKSAGGSGESSSAASLDPTPSKKVKVAEVATGRQEEDSWSTIVQNHTALLESHAQFLSALLKKSHASFSRTPALVSFLSRTHEMLAQAKTIEAISPPIASPTKPTPNSSAPRESTPPMTKKMEGPSENLRSIVLEHRKRTRSSSPAQSPEKLERKEDETREESPMKKIKSVPETPAGPMKSNLKSKLGIRAVGAQFAKNEIPLTPMAVTASTSVPPSVAPAIKQQLKTVVKEQAQEEDHEVSLMEPDDFAAEVAARLRAKEKRKHKIVEGSKGKRRRRSSTVEVEQRRREKRVKRESSGGVVNDQESTKKPRRRISGVMMNGKGGEERRGRE